MPDYTKKQHEAIEARGGNILVSAAAGSGKTTVLVERIIRLIKDEGADVTRMLVVTFTQAAAANMRTKITEALRGSGDARLRRQAAKVQRAEIKTLHAFCSGVLRRFYHLAEVDPDFRVAGDGETTMLREAAMKELFAREYAEPRASFRLFTDMFSSRYGDKGSMDVINEVYDFSRSMPDPSGWLAVMADMYYGGGEAIWKGRIKEITDEKARGAEELLLQCMEICRHPLGPMHNEAVVEADIALCRDILSSDISDVSGLIEEYKSRPQKEKTFTYRKSVDRNMHDRAKALRDAAKTIFDDIEKEAAYAGRDCMEAVRAVAPVMTELHRLVTDYGAIYAGMKAKKNALDYSDLEHIALRALALGADAVYKDKFDYIFVDEYQDTNGVQEAVINSVSRGDNLFLVGDVKQSIYRFRLADPGLFMEKARTYPEKADARLITLSDNFRSREAILHAVNFVFERIMHRTPAEIDYDEDAALRAGSPSQSGGDLPEMHLYIKDDGMQAVRDDDAEELETIQYESIIAASILRGLHDKYDWRDMTILMRSPGASASMIKDVLQALGVPVISGAGDGALGSPEAQIIISLLKLTDNFCRDIPLIAVLRSAIGGLDEDALARIRLSGGRSEPFWACVEKAAESDERLRKLLSDFSRWRRYAAAMPMGEFIRRIYTETGYYSYAAALPGGQARQANLQALLRAAEEYETAFGDGLSGFLAYLDGLADGWREAPEPGEMDLVTLQTIHKSKGLEYPVVLIMGLGKRFNLSDSQGKLLLHGEIGLGAEYFDPDLRVRDDTVARRAVAVQRARESLAEEMRLLYVAMTRAREKLCMIGTVPADIAKYIAAHSSCSEYAVSSGRSFLDWLTPVLLRDPGCAELRAAAEDPPEAESGAPLFSAKLYGRAETDALMRSLAEGGGVQVMSAADGAAVADMFGRVYNYKEDILIPARLSVTAITKQSAEGVPFAEDAADEEARRPVRPFVPSKPLFMQGDSDTLSGAERGTALHFVCQKLNLLHVSSPDEIRAQITDMLGRQLITPAQARAADPRDIYAMFTSNMGRRMLASPDIHREAAFTVAVPASDIGYSSDEPVNVQGIIDCWFCETGPDGREYAVVLDYKSDRLGQGGLAALADKYRAQVKFYAAAVEKLTGLPVDETAIYSFRARRWINV